MSGVRHPCRSGVFLLLLALALPASAGKAAPAEPEPSQAPASLPFSPDARWGGHLKLRGSASDVDERSLYGLVEAGTYADGVFEGRLTNQTFFSDAVYGEVHYEILLSGGDTRETQEELESRFPLLSSETDYLTS
ncbi:MAG: hypothetical protein K9M82_09195, partial [Deltaproteobacteria bacterium]|nr:hypothetical protein [Deltaproteobacteria bacterium]